MAFVNKGEALRVLGRWSEAIMCTASPAVVMRRPRSGIISATDLVASARQHGHIAGRRARRGAQQPSHVQTGQGKPCSRPRNPLLHHHHARL
eukprot:2599931-Rhodomonas_salina.5